ncbi:MAG: PolC-type DNA polymerase III [Mycoplasmoidaceae bacterium]
MKNKFLQFFTKSKILDEREFDIIKDNCEFTIANVNNKISIGIEITSLIDPTVFFKLYQRTTRNSKKDVEIILNVDNVIFNAIDVQEYLDFYNNKHVENLLLKNILKRKKCEIKENDLYIYYLNLTEREILFNEKENFKRYFNIFGINFNDIIFVLDETYKEIELFRSRKLDTKKILAEKQEAEKKPEKRKMPISGSIEPITNLVPEQMNAIIQGEVFKISNVQLQNNRTIYKFFITDYTDSIIIKAFPNERVGLSNQLLNSIEKGCWIKAKIILQIDKYEKNQLSGVIKQISVEDKPKSSARDINSERKRVEFINHTKMTAFEGLIDIKEFSDELINLGYQHLAITDKFNCQIFPTIFNYKKYAKKDLNLIYGFQTFLSEHQCDIVTNPIDQNIWEAQYVVYDIETTGLYPLVDDIIEFGAVKYQNGKVIDRINFFIKTEKALPKFIQELTGITDSMLKDGYDIKTALIKIKEFFGNAVLIAHNGKNFDLKFLNKKLEENNLDLINNCSIDTLILSRARNKKFKSHSLSNISRKLGIFYNEDVAHRADFDAEVLLKVWKNMMEYLDLENIININEINEKLFCIEVISKTRDPLINIHAKNQMGINNLYNLISLANTTPYGKSVLFINDLMRFKNNLIISNSPSEGDVIKEALSGTDVDLRKAISFYDVVFVSPVSCFDHEINRKLITVDGIKKALKRIIEIAESCSKKVIASSDTYYMNEEDEIYYEVYVYTKSIGGKRHRIYSHRDSNAVLPKYHFRTTSELLNDFNFLGKEKAYEIVVTNSNDLATSINYDLIPIKEQLSTPTIDGAKEKLEDLVKTNMLLKYGENPDVSIVQRINKELKAIITNGFSVIYWFSHLLVKKSLDEGYLVGSRGSVGSSLVATLVNITDVNPLPPHYLCEKCKYFKYVDASINSGFDLPNIACPICNHEMCADGHNIPFETFMGFEGEKVPDIDLNFSAEYQAKAHDFIRETFGKANVLRAGTIGTVAEKTAFGYVKGYFEAIGKTDVRDAEIIRIATKCEGVKRTTGQHPGGIIVIPNNDSMFNFTPYNFPADDNTQDWYTTHFAFEFLHDSLLKFDILGHDSPTVIKMLESKTKIMSSTIPNYDKNVMDIFRTASALGIKDEAYQNVPGTLGLPEFGTSFVKEMLSITKPKNFSDLVRISGLSHGTNVWNNNAKDLIEKNNLEISEVISARDDIMIYLMSRSIEASFAFQIMEDVRKGKGLLKDNAEILRANNVPDWYIDSCNKIKYVFPKAHAVAYVHMAWKIAWYKLYYPLHFYASFFTIRSTVFDLENIMMGKQRIKTILGDIKTRLSNPTTKVSVTNKEVELINIYEMSLEMIERGFVIKNINLDLSLEDEYLLAHDGLIPPFSCLDGLGGAAAKSIVDARKEKKFTSKDDFLSRTKITKTLFKKLDELGVLNNLMDDEQISLFE